MRSLGQPQRPLTVVRPVLWRARGEASSSANFQRATKPDEKTQSATESRELIVRPVARRTQCRDRPDVVQRGAQSSDPFRELPHKPARL